MKYAWNQNTRDSYRRRTGTVVPQSGNFGDLTTADHKILSEGSEDTPLWYKIWQLSGYNLAHVKQKLLKRPRRA